MTKFSLICSRCSTKAAPPTQHGNFCKCGGAFEQALIELPRTVTSDYYPTMPAQEVSYALAGTHQAHMNGLGAVFVLDQNGEFLGVRPNEMEWVQGMPDGWCGRRKGNSE